MEATCVPGVTSHPPVAMAWPLHWLASMTKPSLPTIEPTLLTGCKGAYDSYDYMNDVDALHGGGALGRVRAMILWNQVGRPKHYGDPLKIGS